MTIGNLVTSPDMNLLLLFACLAPKPNKTSRFDNLTSEAELVIDLLKERRSALISAAVTGQIDVRNYQPEETA